MTKPHVLSPKGNPDDIVVVTVKHGLNSWLAVATGSAVGALVGGFSGVLLIQWWINS